MKNLEPRGGGRAVMDALLLLVAVSYGAHLIEMWLRPVLPLAIAGAVVLALYRLIRGSRWWL